MTPLPRIQSTKAPKHQGEGTQTVVSWALRVHSRVPDTLQTGMEDLIHSLLVLQDCKANFCSTFSQLYLELLERRHCNKIPPSVRPLGFVAIYRLVHKWLLSLSVPNLTSVPSLFTPVFGITGRSVGRPQPRGVDRVPAYLFANPCGCSRTVGLVDIP
jgi:hypothetical protein